MIFESRKLEASVKGTHNAREDENGSERSGRSLCATHGFALWMMEGRFCRNFCVGVSVRRIGDQGRYITRCAPVTFRWCSLRSTLSRLLHPHFAAMREAICIHIGQVPACEIPRTPPSSENFGELIALRPSSKLAGWRADRKRLLGALLPRAWHPAGWSDAQ